MIFVYVCVCVNREQEQEQDAEHESTDIQIHKSPIQTSRWSKYLDTPKEVDPEQEHEDDMVLMDRQNCPSNRMTNRCHLVDFRQPL